MLVQNMNIKWKHLHGRNHTGVCGHTNCGLTWTRANVGEGHAGRVGMFTGVASYCAALAP